MTLFFVFSRFFEIGRITAAGRAAGAIVGWDLAHAVGNVILKVSDNIRVRNTDTPLFVFRSHVYVFVFVSFL